MKEETIGFPTKWEKEDEYFKDLLKEDKELAEYDGLTKNKKTYIELAKELDERDPFIEDMLLIKDIVSTQYQNIVLWKDVIESPQYKLTQDILDLVNKYLIKYHN